MDAGAADVQRPGSYLILGRFLFRPVAAIIEERRAAAVKLLADAEAAKQEANAAREAANGEAAQLANTRDEALRQAAAAAERERAAALVAARTEVDQLRVAAEAEIQRERHAEAAAASDRAARLAVEITEKLLTSPAGLGARRRIRRRTG